LNKDNIINMMSKVYGIYGSGAGGNEILSFIKNDKKSDLKNILL